MRTREDVVYETDESDDYFEADVLPECMISHCRCSV